MGRFSKAARAAASAPPDSEVQVHLRKAERVAADSIVGVQELFNHLLRAQIAALRTGETPPLGDQIVRQLVATLAENAAKIPPVDADNADTAPSAADPSVLKFLQR